MQLELGGQPFSHLEPAHSQHIPRAVHVSNPCRTRMEGPAFATRDKRHCNMIHDEYIYIYIYKISDKVVRCVVWPVSKTAWVQVVMY